MFLPKFKMINSNLKVSPCNYPQAIQADFEQNEDC